MAAKQGLTAHMAQASDDARRAVLNRVGATWLSNLNTTCTIKSAPPRTPEVMTMLSVRAGWLVKRNESHVWQRRWCCVVPHTFLYYFEAEPLNSSHQQQQQQQHQNGGYGLYQEGGVYPDEEYGNSHSYVAYSGGGVNPNYSSNNNTPSEKLSSRVENQDALNNAVKNGLSCPSPRISSNKAADHNSYNNYSNSNNNNNNNSSNSSIPLTIKDKTEDVRGPVVAKGHSNLLSPVGIIDLECYTNINRSSVNECVFELSGDEITNPDLRSFFFQAGSLQECEEWSHALLSDRHSSLKDERDAYKQVCDSCTLQYRNLSQIIEEAESRSETAEQEVYKIRSASQTLRTKIQALVKDTLLAHANNNHNNNNSTDQDLDLLESTRQDLLTKIDLFANNHSDDTLQLVQFLVDYIASLHLVCSDMSIEKMNMEQKLVQNVNIDKVAINSIRAKMQDVLNDKLNQEKHHQQALDAHQQEINDLKNEIQSQRMEFTMFQSQAKTKLRDLVQHKKILKKEVIDLRTKVEDAESDLNAERHSKQTLDQDLIREKEKTALLEKYIAKMEKQIAQQQNIMEIMSHSGSVVGPGSVVGRIVSTNNNTNINNINTNSEAQALPNQHQQQQQQQQQQTARLPPSYSSRAPLPPRSATTPPYPNNHSTLTIDTNTNNNINTNNINNNTSNNNKDDFMVASPSPISLHSSFRQDVVVNDCDPADADYHHHHNDSSYLETASAKDGDANSFVDDGAASSVAGGSLSHAERMMKYRKVLSKRNNKPKPQNEKEHNNNNNNYLMHDDDAHNNHTIINNHNKSTDPTTPNHLHPNHHHQHDDECEDDDKSRISELTEDRTQRAFDSVLPQMVDRLVLEDDYNNYTTTNNNNTNNNTNNLLKAPLTPNNLPKINLLQSTNNNTTNTNTNNNNTNTNKNTSVAVSESSNNNNMNDNHTPKKHNNTNNNNNGELNDDNNNNNKNNNNNVTNSYPPRYIGGTNNNNNSNINNNNNNNNNNTQRLLNGIPPKHNMSDTASYLSTGSGKMSVAQRARLEANQKSKTNAIRINASTVLNDIYNKANSNAADDRSIASSVRSHNDNSVNEVVKSTSSARASSPAREPNRNENHGLSLSINKNNQSHISPSVTISPLKPKNRASTPSRPSTPTRPSTPSAPSTPVRKWSLGERLVNVIDNSRLGVKIPTPETDEMTTSSNATNLTIAQRQQLQREKQLAFLKQQGILKDDEELRGGAGGGLALSASCDVSVSSSVQ